MRLVFALLFVSTLAVADDEIVATSLNGQVTSSTPMIGGVSIAVDTNVPNLDVDLLGAVPTSTSYLVYMRGFNGTTGQGILTFLQVDSDTVLRLTNCPDI